MCDTCGCGEPSVGHTHGEGNTHTHDVGQPVLDLNQQLAEENAGFFRERGILCLNLLSSPGSGKTTLLEHLVEEGQVSLDLEDEITSGTLVARGSEVVHPVVKRLLGGADSGWG